MKELTERQSEILQYIIDYKSVNQYSPAIRDIACRFGIDIKAAYDHVTAIERKGHIERDARISRGIRVV